MKTFKTEMEIDEVASLELLTKLKNEANSHVQAGNFVKARDIYVHILSRIPGQLQNFLALRVACLNNLAMVYLQLEEYSQTIMITKLSLEIDPTNVKAYFRQAQGFEMLNHDEEALKCIAKLLYIESNNSQAQQMKIKLESKSTITTENTKSSVIAVPILQKEHHNDNQQESKSSELVEEQIVNSASGDANDSQSHPQSCSGDMLDMHGFLIGDWRPGQEETPREGGTSILALTASSSAIGTLLEHERQLQKLRAQTFRQAVASSHGTGNSIANGSTLASSTVSLAALQDLKSGEQHIIHQVHHKVAATATPKDRSKARGGGEGRSNGKSGRQRGSESSSTGSNGGSTAVASSEWERLLAEEEQIKQVFSKKLSSVREVAQKGTRTR